MADTRMRQWTLVFPAYAGVFLLSAENSEFSLGLPRIRGGVSLPDIFRFTVIESSPHTRGCFLQKTVSKLFMKVFPAYAGVFLNGLI